MRNLKDKILRRLNYFQTHWIFSVFFSSIIILLILYIIHTSIFWKVVLIFKDGIPYYIYIQTAEIYLFLFIIFFIPKFIIWKIDNEYINKLVSIFYILVIFCSLLKLYYLLIIWDTNIYLMNNNIHIDKYANYIKLITIIASMFVFIFMAFEKEQKSYLNSEISWIMLICILAMLLFTTSNNLILMYLFLELQSFGFYLLCATKRYSNKSIEASLKYYIYGSYSSIIILLGISLLYGITGTLNFDDLHLFNLPSDIPYEYEIILNFAKFCILLGLLFKLAVFPYHWWLVDIYEGTSSIITFFFAIVPKFSIFYMFYKLYFLVFIDNEIINILIGFSCIFSILLGTIWALYEWKFKKFLAYSTIVHMGYIIIPLILDNNFGIVVATYYFMIYLIINLSIFSVFLVFKKYNNTPITNITDFIDMKKNNKMLSILYAISLLSLAGIPPLAGFYGKLLIFNLLISTGNYLMFFFFVILSIVSSIYYIRLIRFLFFSDRDEEYNNFYKKIPDYLSLLIIIIFILNIIFLFAQGALLLFILQLSLI